MSGRVVIIEEAGNGYVVRARGDAGHGAVVFSEPQALKHALEHARAYLLSPRGDETASATFPALAHSVEETSALERKDPRYTSTPALTVDTQAETRLMGAPQKPPGPRWARPSPPGPAG